MQVMWQQHPQVPWIQFAPCGCQTGGFFVKDTRTGEEVKAPDLAAINQFIADRSRSQSHYAVGDAVHSVTKAMGIPRCGGCAKRQTALNNFFRR